MSLFRRGLGRFNLPEIAREVIEMLPGSGLEPPLTDASIQLRSTTQAIQWQHTGDALWQTLKLFSELTGADGKPVQMQVSDTAIQWRLNGGDWSDLIPLSAIAGAPGANGVDGDKGEPGKDGINGLDGAAGRSVELQIANDHIEWRHSGDEAWQTLISLSALKGADGLNGTNGIDGARGTDGANGHDGINGRSVELDVGNGYVRWRLVGDTAWIDLVSLTSLTGAKGADGTNGTNGTNGLNGVDGKSAEMSVGDGFLRWRQAGTLPWINLVAMTTLQGSKGDNGDAAVVATVGAPVSRSLAVGTAYQASNPAKPAILTITLTANSSLTLTGASNNEAAIIMGATAGVASGVGVSAATYRNRLSGALTLSLNVNSEQANTYTILLPAGYYFSINRTVGTGLSVLSAIDQALG